MVKKKTDAEKTIEDLPGIGPSTADKLREGGFTGTLEIAVATPEQLVAMGGLGLATAIKCISEAQEIQKFGFETAGDLAEKRKSLRYISTGSKGINELLGGGIESGNILEVHGEYGSSKSQIGHMICVQAVKDYPDMKVIYIDTENSFRPNRLRDFARGAGVDEELVLKQVMIAPAFNSSHQMLLAKKVENMLKGGDKISLLIVDSLTSHFRSEFVGRGTLSARQMKLTQHIAHLAKIAVVYGVAVFVTNQVMTNPGVMFGDPTMPIGGNALGHAAHYRLYLRKGKQGSRVAKLMDAPDRPDGSVNYLVEGDGFKDV